MAVALVVRRVVVYDGVERQVGDVIELTPIRAAMARAQYGTSVFGWAKEQPKATPNHQPPTTKRSRRRKAAAQVGA